MLVPVNVFGISYRGKKTAKRETPRVRVHTHNTLIIQARLVCIIVGVGRACSQWRGGLLKSNRWFYHIIGLFV